MSDESFLVVCEVGLGNFTLDRYTREGEARAAAAKLWCCWVLYKSSANATVLQELKAGGVGFSHPNIRAHSERNIKSKARDADARVNAAAAAEARAAKLAQQAPKQKPTRPAATNADGRPDVSNPAVWD